MDVIRTCRMLLALGLVATALIGYPPDAAAQNDVTGSSGGQTEAERKAPEGFLGIVFSGGLTGFVIVLVLLALSIGTAALVIEHILSIRANVVMPPGLAENVQRLLLAGNSKAAEEACRHRPSFLAFVLQSGIAEVDGGWNAVEKAMEDGRRRTVRQAVSQDRIPVCHRKHRPYDRAAGNCVRHDLRIPGSCRQPGQRAGGGSGHWYLSSSGDHRWRPAGRDPVPRRVCRLSQPCRPAGC